MRSILPRTAVILTAALFLVLAAETNAQAHKVNVFAWVEGDRVICDAYFSKSRKVQGGKISVVDPADGRVLLEGKTDENGFFSFNPPPRSDLKIVLDAGLGHRADWTIKAAELPGSAVSGPAPTAGGQSAFGKAPAADSAGTGPAGPALAPGLDPETLKKIITEAVSRAVAEETRPLARAVARLQEPDEGPNLKDIVGGLGWIVGIMGLILFFRGKKASRG